MERTYRFGGTSLCLLFILSSILLARSIAFGAPDEADWKVLFLKACGECHGSTPKYPILWARTGYQHSKHYRMDTSFYANGVECQRCHTNEGFIDYIDSGRVPPQKDLLNTSQPGCCTCHDPHKTGDFSIRTVAALKLANGRTFDRGKGNHCAECHQARASAKQEVKAMPAKGVGSAWGAHHGPQADMVAGTNAYEFPGKTYSSSDHFELIQDGCISCHMDLPKGRRRFSPGIGGMSFGTKDKVHEFHMPAFLAGEHYGDIKVNTTACVECHKNMKQVKGGDIYDIKADADFDNDGKVDPLQAEVTGLLRLFVNEEGTGYLQKLDPPMYRKDGTWVDAKEGKWSLDQMAALYNYKFVLEDRSRGVHNAPYAVQILYDSLEMLDPKFDTSKRPK